MATTNPRVQVMLTKATHRALSSLAKRYSRSMSSLAAEVLNAQLPNLAVALEHVASQMLKLSPDEQEARRRQIDMWADQAHEVAGVELERLYTRLQGHMGGVGERGVGQRAERGTPVTRPPAGRRRKGSTPHRTNRGV